MVILKENMRQKSQTANDAKFRKCLEHMRYGACTEADIKLLRSRIVGRGPGKPKLSDHNKFSLTRCGITPRRSIAFNAKIMLATAVSYQIQN